MIDVHRRMLGDRIRNEAFKKALQEVVIPGKSVVSDIGAGTGFLGFIASKLGAKECLLYEYGDVIRVAKLLAKEHHIQNVRFIDRHSRDVKNPVKADIVCSETLGNFALEEHILETMNDARKRHLKPGGELIPCRISQFLCPVVTDRFTKEIDTWDLSTFGLDFSSAREMCFNNIYVRTVKGEDLLPDGAQKFDDIDLREEHESRRSATVRWLLKEDVPIFGFAVWWEAELRPGITISTSPFSKPTHWEQIFVPLPSMLDCKKGDTIECSFSSDTRWESGVNVTWQATVSRNGKKVASSETMDMKKGFIA